jgi:hypothetical protein
MNWLTVEGESMRPMLAPGDRVAVEWDPDGQPAAGELVVARSADNRSFFVHRVIRAGRALETKGDSAFCAETVGEGELWARVVGVRIGESGVERSVEVTVLDRLIAAISARSAGTAGLRARIGRKVTYLLSWLRRSFL